MKEHFIFIDILNCLYDNNHRKIVLSAWRYRLFVAFEGKGEDHDAIRLLFVLSS